MNGDRRFTFPEREYYRACAMCGFMADPGYPWDEKLQRMEYCPRCGIPLERLACQARVTGSGVVATRVLPPYADASAARLPQEWVAP